MPSFLRLTSACILASSLWTSSQAAAGVGELPVSSDSGFEAAIASAFKSDDKRDLSDLITASNFEITFKNADGSPASERHLHVVTAHYRTAVLKWKDDPAFTTTATGHLEGAVAYPYAGFNIGGKEGFVPTEFGFAIMEGAGSIDGGEHLGWLSVNFVAEPGGEAWKPVVHRVVCTPKGLDCVFTLDNGVLVSSEVFNGGQARDAILHGTSEQRPKNIVINAPPAMSAKFTLQGF